MSKYALIDLLEQGPNIDRVGLASGWTVAIGFSAHLTDLAGIPGVTVLSHWAAEDNNFYVLLSHDDLSLQPDETTQIIRVMIAPWCRVTMWTPQGQSLSEGQIAALVTTLKQDDQSAGSTIKSLLEASGVPCRILWYAEVGLHDVGLDYVYA